MRRVLYTLVVFALFASISIAQMQLKLPAEITGKKQNDLIEKNLESNFQLQMPAEVTAPGGMRNFVKGMFLIGLLADLSIPFGDEDTGFKHIAGTGFSVHAMASYMVAASFMLSLRVGYVGFGQQVTEGSEFGQDFRYEDCYYQIPILFGAYYLFATGSMFRPYIGLALGAFIQKYSYKWSWTYSGFGTEQTFNEEGDASSTGFGLVPTLGFYYILGSVMLHAAVEYAFLLSNLPEVTGDNTTLEKFNGYTGIAQEEEDTDVKASYLSILLGVSIPLGGK